MARLVTPFGYKLQTELSNEFSRMDSEWFFPWHGLNSGREVDVDRFDGRRIHLSGGSYGGSDESAYWSAVGRYLNNKVNDAFELAEREIRLSGRCKAPAIADDAANVVEEYCSRIRQHAIDTDRRLVGRGYPDPNYSSPRASRMEFKSEIARRKAVLVGFHMPEEVPAPSLPSPPPLPLSKRYERFYDGHKAKWATAALMIGAVGAAFAILRFLF